MTNLEVLSFSLLMIGFGSLMGLLYTIILRLFSFR